MCGISGIWRNSNSSFDFKSIERMKLKISHRGPDGNGTWRSKGQKVILGHNRLSIIDLSENGAQPMTRGDYTISFNGEIYNYLEIKKELENKNTLFSTDSDTEVLLAAYQRWGADMLQKLDGMFAFAIYDEVKDELFCARDRFGEKPFYYGFYNGDFYFASEIKALWEIGIDTSINENLLFNYLHFDLVENPHNQKQTFYKEINKLRPSHSFIYKGGNQIKQSRYWNISISDSVDISFSDASYRFKELLNTSVERRLRSDVKVGSSLSGGLDSSSIVALVSKLSNENATFSARFKNFSKDEGEFIEIIQNKFNTKHFNVNVQEMDLIKELDRLIYHQEEPFQTGSIYAQYCVYQEAKKRGGTVMLDGQGADEFLGGYSKDFQFYFRELINNKSERLRINTLLNKNHNINTTLSYKDKLLLRSPKTHKFVSSVEKKISNKRPRGIHPDFYAEFKNKNSPFEHFTDLKSALRHEMNNQGLEKLLRFADKNSMAHSVEVRLPFLYHELVEFVFSLPSSYLLHNGWSKSILRASMSDILPSEITYRKDKIGFQAPQDSWMQKKFFKEILKEAEQSLIQNKFITSDYTAKWKILVAYKTLFERTHRITI